MSAGLLRFARRGVLVAVGLALSLAAMGCAQDPRGASNRSGSSVCPPVPGPIVDPKLLAFLSRARSAHHEADVLEDTGDRAGAVRSLLRVVEGRGSFGAAPPPEVAEVVADAYARLADLRSALGDFDAAARDVTEGLALVETPTYFRGHLFEVSGLVHQRRADARLREGDSAAAASEKQEAVKAFEQAIEIQDEVIAGALRDAGTP